MDLGEIDFMRKEAALKEWESKSLRGARKCSPQLYFGGRTPPAIKL